MANASQKLGTRIARYLAGDLIRSGLADSVAIESTGNPIELYASPLQVRLDQRNVLGPWVLPRTALQARKGQTTRLGR